MKRENAIIHTDNLYERYKIIYTKFDKKTLGQYKAGSVRLNR